MEIEKIYPLSPMQEEMFFHWLYNKKSFTYFGQNLFTIDAEIEKSIFEKSLNMLIERYDILRTIFRSESVPQPIQIVLKKRKFTVYFEDMSHLDEEEQEKQLEDFTKKDRETGFDLTRNLLMRTSLFKTGEHWYKLLWSYHHIIMDGWCVNIIFRDFIQIYYSLVSSRPLNLKPVTPYKNFISWINKQNKEEGVAFWRQYLNGFKHQTGLTKFGKSNQQVVKKKEEYKFRIDKVLSKGLISTARKNQVTVNTVFQTIWGILLQRYNNTNEVVFGKVVSGRPPEIEGIEDMIGVFMNTIPIRITLKENQPLSQAFREVQESETLTKSYEYLSLAEIQMQSPLKSNLIDHIIAFENYPLAEEMNYLINTDTPGSTSKSSGGEFGVNVKDMQLFQQGFYEFNMAIIPGKQFLIKIYYNAAAFDRTFIEEILNHLDELISQVVYHPQIKLENVNISNNLKSARSGIPRDEYLKFCF